VIIDFAGDVTVEVASGPGGINAGTTTLPFVTGAATFNDIVIQKAGTYTFRVVSGALGFNVSSPFTITPAAASVLGFSVQPQNTMDNVPVPDFAVTAYDAHGNVVATFTGEVTVAVNTGSGAITGATRVNAISGVARFTGLRIATADTYTLRATSDSLATAVSQSFFVSRAMPFRLRLLTTVPSPLPVSGILPPVTVQLVDELGFTVNAPGIAVNVSFAGGDPCGLFGTISGVTDANGQFIFTNLGIQRTGRVQLEFVSPGLASALSNAFEVIPSVIPSQRRWR
jgi:hypothetical protein